MTDPDARLIARARDAATVIAPLGGAIEAERRLPPVAVEALVSAGFFKLFAPSDYGGSEASAETAVLMIEEVARADGSAGWCAMIGATSSLMCSFLPDAVAREVFGPEGATTSGVFAPLGRATVEPRGYRVSGRWPFASGCEHSAWRMGGALVAGAETLPGGGPNVRCMLFRASDMRVLDTWDTSGLRGSGSHDVEVTDVFVPEERTFSLLTDAPRHVAGTSALPFFGVLAAGVAAVALGIARAAIEALVLLANAKEPQGARRTLAHRERVQLAVAQAEGKLRAARAFLTESLRDAALEAGSSGAPSIRARALVRVAASHATRAAAEAVDLAYDTGGASSIYSKNPLQRHFRDVHVATQHVMVGPTAMTLGGRVLLGLESDTSML